MNFYNSEIKQQRKEPNTLLNIVPLLEAAYFYSSLFSLESSFGQKQGAFIAQL